MHVRMDADLIHVWPTTFHKWQVEPEATAQNLQRTPMPISQFDMHVHELDFN